MINKVFICNIFYARCIPKDEAIDLLNVAFEQRVNQQHLNARKKSPKESEKKEPYDVPDRITGKSGVCELNPNRRWNFIEVKSSFNLITHVVRQFFH